MSLEPKSRVLSLESGILSSALSFDFGLPTQDFGLKILLLNHAAITDIPQ